MQITTISKTVKKIKDCTFNYCMVGLTVVTLGRGLKEIGEEAFYRCTLLQCIAVPPSVNDIFPLGWRNILTTRHKIDSDYFVHTRQQIPWNVVA